MSIKPSDDMKLSGIWFYLFCLIAFFISCQVKNNGCLDIEAKNFQLDAEKACTDCCQYPDVALLLTQKWADENFSTDSIYADAAGTPFRIVDFRYLLSDWSWRNAQQDIFHVDSLAIRCGENVLHYMPDLPMIEPRRFQYILGTRRITTDVADISFSAGYRNKGYCFDRTISTTPAAFRASSVLLDTLSNQVHAIWIVVEQQQPEISADTLLFGLNQTLSLSIPLSYQMTKGASAIFPVTVDYHLLFQDAVISDLQTFGISFFANGPVAFSQTPP